MKLMRSTSHGPRATIWICIIFCVVRGSWPAAQANEVLDSQEIPMPKSGAAVMVRENSKTATPYIVITDPLQPRKDLAALDSNKYRRPDYRMLQKGVTAKDVGYDGPYSSKKKIYILAATLATAGATAAIVGPALFPAAAATGVAGGSVAVPAAAAAVGGSALAVAAKKYQDHFQNLPDDYNRESESKIVETETDFYQMYVAKKTAKPFQLSPEAGAPRPEGEAVSPRDSGLRVQT